MSGKRKYWFSKRYQVRDIGGYQILMLVVDDLTNEELRKALEYFVEREDWEYCAALKAEADLRSIKLENKIGCQK